MATDSVETPLKPEKPSASPNGVNGSSSAFTDTKITPLRQPASASSSRFTNGSVKVAQSFGMSRASTKQKSPQPESSNVRPAFNDAFRSPPLPVATSSQGFFRASPSRSPPRQSRNSVTPNALRNTTSSSSRSSPRRSPLRREATYSPSQQLHDEFARFHLDSQVAFHAKLDQKSGELAQQHNRALEDAATKHEKVLENAREAQELLQLQKENEATEQRLKKEEMAEMARRKQVALEEAAQQRKLDAAMALEREVQRQRDQARQTAEAEDRARKESERLANEARQREEDEKKSRLAQEAASEKKRIDLAQQAKQQPATQTTVAPVKPSSSVVSHTAPNSHARDSPLMQWSKLEQTHTKYLDLHRKLKTMRKNIMDAYKQAKGNPRSPVAQLADMRRSLAKLLGQLTSDKAKNKSIVSLLSPYSSAGSVINVYQRTQVEQIMATAWNITDIAMDAKEYVLETTQPWPASGNTQVSGVFIYLVNILTKIAIESMGAASRQSAFNAVDYYGVVLSWIVSNSKFRLHGNSFADIVVAKFHAACPPLFGVYGSESTMQGRKRLGWRDGDSSQEHFDKVNALAIGWGALTLRDYTRLANQQSAIPAWHYWQSLACIVNVPPAELTKTHSIVLKGLIDQYAHLFIKFYGMAAIVVLRRALVQLPEQAPEAAGFDKVKVVKDNLYNRLKLQL